VQAGKHVLCEKPLARTAQEAKAMWEAAQKSGVKHMTGFNYRFVWISNWWPRGHVIGWEHTFVHEIAHLLDCIVNDRDVGPYGATFEDGYRANVVSDAVMLSAMTKSQVDIKYW
ncbi:MAG: Gfo/Idh/MocA family oxidoreductase, partial [Anaerolineae bacterium]|nr:Gfo/Idh/MocA family oxidoreductase [Anaerolineae bacterium]